MNFNKDYPIAILDTNIAMDIPNILNILKGCNIVIPYTIMDELDKQKKGTNKKNKNARDFINNFLDISKKANLSKDGYKLDKNCMLYLDMDRNNLRHREISFDSKKQDFKFIAEAKNLKEKYNDMTVVLLSSDKIMQITALNCDVMLKTLGEFVTEDIKDDDKIIILNNLYNINNKYLKNKDLENSKKIHNIITKIISNISKNEKDINKLYELAEKYNSKEIYGKIYEFLYKDKDTEKLYKLAEKYKPNKMYEKIFEILIENKDINGLYELIKNHNYKPNREKITEVLTEHCNILTDSKDISGLYELAEKFNSKKIYERIFEILIENKDINGLYELIKNHNYKPNREKITEVLTEHCNILTDSKDISGLYELAEKFNSKKIYERIFEILMENKDIDELNKLYKKICELDEKGITGYKGLIKIIVSKIKVLESNNI